MEMAKIEEYEKQYKDAIFNKIGEIHSKQFEVIEKMEKNAKSLGLSQVNISNVVITLNNKLVELSNIFKTAGISMFSVEIKDHGLLLLLWWEKQL